MTQHPEEASLEGSVQFINPDDLPKNPAYTNVVAVTGSVKWNVSLIERLSDSLF
jgi:hypothetical protein